VFAVVSLLERDTSGEIHFVSYYYIGRYIMHRSIITTSYLHHDNIALPSTKKVIYYDLFFVFLTYKIYNMNLTCIILKKKGTKQNQHRVANIILFRHPLRPIHIEVPTAYTLPMATKNYNLGNYNKYAYVLCVRQTTYYYAR